MELAATDYLEGAAFALAAFGACGLTGWIVVARRLPWLRGSAEVVAVFLLATALLAAVHLLPGALGILSRWAVLASALVVAAAVLRFVPAAEPHAPESHVDQPGGREERWLARAGVLLAAIAALSYVIARSTEPLSAVDALTTHIPTVARWIQEGSFWQLVQYAPDLSNATYPHNGTLMMLAAVLPWDHTFLVRFVDVPFLAAAATGVFAIARELRAPSCTAALAAAAMTTLAAVNEPAFEQAQVDAPMLAWFTIGAFFLLRSSRNGRLAETVLAGLGLGLAFGTKWYAVVYVPLLMLPWLVVRRRDRGGVAALIAATGAAGGFWFVRNWVETGNPVHPAKVAFGGTTIFDAPPDPLREMAGFTVSDYLFDGRVWGDHFVPAYGGNFGILGPLFLMAAVVTIAVTARRGRGAPLTVAALALVLAVVYTKVPDTAFGLPGEPVLVGANARYLVPALLGGALAAAWLGRRWPLAVGVLLFAGIVDGVVRSYDGIAAGDVARALLLSAVAWLIWWSVRSRPPNAVVATAGLVILLLGIGSELRQRAAVAPLAERDPVIGWLARELPGDARIGLGKTWTPGGISPVLPAFGARLGNDVDYLGRFVDGTLRQWRRQEGFQAQIRGGDYDALVIGTGVPARAGGEEPQVGWARELGYTERVRTDRLVLLAR